MMLFLIAFSCQNAKYADTAQISEFDTATTEETDCTVNWDGWTDGFFATYCRACHSVTTAERYGAPEGIDFDTKSDVLQWAERIRVRVLEEETMPLGGGVVRTELQPLDQWLQCMGNAP